MMVMLLLDFHGERMNFGSCCDDLESISETNDREIFDGIVGNDTENSF